VTGGKDEAGIVLVNSRVCREGEELQQPGPGKSSYIVHDRVPRGPPVNPGKAGKRIGMTQIGYKGVFRAFPPKDEPGDGVSD